MSRSRLAVSLAALYLVLLAASHTARLWRGEAKAWPAGLQAVHADGITIALRETGRRGAGTPVLLLHGSPGSSADFSTLAPALAGRFRTLAPDLPGFGRSRARLSSYSIRNHARLMLAMLDTLEIPKVHVVGFSMGGGVALEMAAEAPTRLASITLLSSIGVQELELLGSYPLNRAVHLLQLAALWLLHEATPHFGLLDGFPLDIPYARNFFDSDQRPLRDVLRVLTMPTLIMHGRNDVLVPVAAAREHHRLVPHSELELFEANHFLVFRHGDRLAPALLGFLQRVDNGAAASRDRADPRRIAAAERPFDAAHLPQTRGLALVALMALLALATLVSEDLASIGTGLLVAQGRLGFLAGALACWIGILLGDVAIYLSGRYLGRPWLGRAPLSWLLSPSALARSERWFASRGHRILFASRFLPGTRVATYFGAGVLGVGFWRFTLILSLAVAAWVPLLVGAAAFVGARMFELFEVFATFALPGVAALAILGWTFFHLVRALFSWRARRLLVGRLRRLRHWEFWPPWLLYAPVVGRCVLLALRHRSPTVFTCANPAIPAGGFVGESKAQILAALDRRYVADYRLLPAAWTPARRLGAIREFLAERNLGYPVVLKPDVGQRGRAVQIVHSPEALAAVVETISTETLVQEYVAGPELGVFYARRPGEERGRIISVTNKRLPEVRGDGRSTIEHLILADDRAVVMAEAYFQGLSGRLDEVPGPGQVVQLVDVGTHCRGAVFLDGRDFVTPALTAAVEAISRSCDGFFFGRYDLKAPSHEHFKNGVGLKVLELNGVTSEVTHIYDPANTLFDAYRALLEQWELAYEIGGLNADHGAAPASLAELARLLWAHWRS